MGGNVEAVTELTKKWRTFVARIRRASHRVSKNYKQTANATMSTRKLPAWKVVVFYITGFSALILLIALVGELSVRAFVSLRNTSYPTHTTVSDPYLGSRAIANFQWNGTITDAGGKEYELHLSTESRGFRLFGDTSTTRKKVFFIGDSFTQAIESSDKKTYFSLLADSLDFEAFAYGCRGYSTLQEWMLLEKYLPLIRPDVVVLQFCSNDFLNNHYELERHSLLNNNRRKRPYLNLDGSIFYGVPARWGWNWLDERSMFFELLFTRFERLMDGVVAPESNSEYHIEQQGINYSPYSESIEITTRLLKKFRDELPENTKLLVFTVDNYSPFYQTISEICYRQHIPFVGYVPQFLDSLDRQGQTTRSLDGAHWNELAHAVAADLLACELQDYLEVK
jgi:lysophospholipase L1-like esterase